ncbi:unnamed protein product, partial [Bubo scandiacus]
LRDGVVSIPKFKHAHGPKPMNTRPVPITKWICLGVSDFWRAAECYSNLQLPPPAKPPLAWDPPHQPAPWSVASKCTARKA